MPPAAAKTDLERAYEALKVKQETYTALLDYYDGDQPIRYVSQRLADVFQIDGARFTENWTAVVVDSELERIRLREFDIADAAAPTAAPPSEGETLPENPAQARLNDLFAETELNLDAEDVHKVTLVTGEAFICAWKDEETGEIEAYYNDPRLCHVFYDPAHPRKKSFAAKWWIGDDGRRYLNLYYTDKILYYVSKGKAENVGGWKAFGEAEPEEANPFGVIPVFHFRYDRRKIKSAIANVIEPQDAINKLFADMMVAAEFGAFKQRWILTNADITTLKNSPNEIWKIPAGDGADESTQVGEFDPTELGNYLTSMEKLANDIARITRTPKHYFYAQGGDPSGEALIAMEAPLNHKAQSTIDKVKPVWAEVASFLLLLDGQTVEAGKITPVFARPETVQPRTQAEIRQIDVNAGIPLINCVRREGWTEEEIAALEEDIADAKAGAQGNPVTDADLSDVVNQLSDLFPELSADGSQPASSTNQPSRPPPAPARTPPSANGRPAAPPRR